MLPAPLWSIRKRKADGLSWENRRILDLKATLANKLVEWWERVALPRSLDHARDMAQLSPPAGSSFPPRPTFQRLTMYAPHPSGHSVQAAVVLTQGPASHTGPVPF